MIQILAIDLISTEGFCDYTRAYGAHVVMVTLLSAITIYRREMSVNHVYVDDDSDDDEGRDEHDQRHKRRELPHSSGEVPLTSPLDDHDVDDLLDKAGNYCSGESLLVFLYPLWNSIFYEAATRQTNSIEEAAALLAIAAKNKTTASRNEKGSSGLPLNLPPDMQVHVFSYLHPKDVVTFACTSRRARNFVDNDTSSEMLWTALWKRDFGWLVQDWDIGNKALMRTQRMFPEPTPRASITKQFYFRFGLCYGNYILAGHNTIESSLVMIHGHVYDITDFLDKHPGSPDPLLVQCGKDATTHFEGTRHSLIARRFAKRFCVAVNAFCTPDGCGVHPTENTSMTNPLMASDTISTVDGEKIPFLRSGVRQGSTLLSVKQQFQKEECEMRERADRTCGKIGTNLLGVANVFYDPFAKKWFAWYTDASFTTVYQYKCLQDLKEITM